MKMSYSFPLNITVLLSLVIFVFYLLGIHNLLTSFQENGCEMTYMFQYPQFVEISLPEEIQKTYPKYALYGYGEGGITEQLRKMKFKGIPVLFIPGSSGSHKQGRSLASVSLRKSLNSRTSFHFNYFMIDFNKEQVAYYGGFLEDQTNFASYCIKKILTFYQNNEYNKPKSVILIGHSFGGLIAKGTFMTSGFDPQMVHLIITLAAPHKYPLLQNDYYISSYYENLHKFWTNNSALQHVNLISIGGGQKDIIVRSDVTFDKHSDINVLTTAVPGVWIPNDHLSIMWCKQLMLTIIRALFDSVDTSTKQIFLNKKYVNSVFQYHFLKRSAGKQFSGSLTSRFSSFEKSSNWFENLQRQFTVTEPKGLKSYHYIMIRLFSDEKSEAVFIQTFNVNIRDWVFVCSADLVHNSVRICEIGENLSNLTEIMPTGLEGELKRKFVYLNLLKLKAKQFTHVVVRLPPSDSYMSVNVDVHQPSERNVNYQVPKFYSLSSETVISNTENNSGYYTVRLVGFEYIWQSYFLEVKVLSCKFAKNNAVVSFISPWANEDRHFIFSDKNFLSISLSLINPKPRNFNSSFHPYVRFHLDPTCKYQVSIKPSLIGMFAQGARYYSLLLPAFLATVVILTLRQQILLLKENKCILFHSVLSCAVRRYYIILQATILGSKLLGLRFFLNFLPVPNFLTLQEMNLDSFFLTILLYAVAIIIIYILGAAVYAAIIMSGQAAYKMALRFIAKTISGIFNWSEWVIAAMHQAPFFVAIILISLSISTTGALALWLGTFFYFLKLSKMYEDYLENLFNYSIKLVAKKVKDVVAGKPKAANQSQKEDINTNLKVNKEEGENVESELRKPQDSSKENNAESDETNSLSAIHFHITVFLVWLLIALLYIPSLLMWAKNYHLNIFLEKDPSIIPSILVSASGAVLWQPGVPKSCQKFTQITSTSLFLLAVISIIYASLSLYRLGYILSASLIIVSLNQVSSK